MEFGNIVRKASFATEREAREFKRALMLRRANGELRVIREGESWYVTQTVKLFIEVPADAGPV